MSAPQATFSGVPASRAQVSYINDLLRDRLCPPDAEARMRQTLAEGNLDKGIASKSIDWLKRQPRRPAEVVVPAPAETLMAMEAQLQQPADAPRYTQADLDDMERDMDAMVQEHERLEDERVAREKWERDEALNAEHAQVENDAAAEVVLNGPVTEPGMYRNAEGIFLVQWNRPKTRLYAKRLTNFNGTRLTGEGEHVKFHYVYANGAIFRLRAGDKMTFEEAKRITLLARRCMKCNRKLEAAESVERGIGPVCRQYFV